MVEFKPVATTSLIITRNWETVTRSNPKYERMLKRRRKILQNIEGYLRQIDLLESLLIQHADHEDRILDVACGFGFYLMELRARGWKNVWGLEIDPNLTRLMVEAATLFGMKVQGQVGDACAIPFTDNSFAIVISKSFFEHVHDVDLALREQIRILRPGGRLIILDGNLLNPKALLDLLVLYPLRTRGRHGGIRWLLTKHKVYRNLYGYLPKARDEDIHTRRWWRRRLSRQRGLRLINSNTTGEIFLPWLPRVLSQFVGGCVAIAEKL